MHQRISYPIILMFIIGFLVALAPLSDTVLASPLEIENFATTTVTCANFGTLAPGESVEGLGKVHPDLSISSSTSSVEAIFENQFPAAYGSPGGLNANLGVLEGFSDVNKVHDYEFSFSPDKAVSYFSVRMLDYGDLNKVSATEHEVSLVAYDVNGFVVANSTLAFTSDSSFNPTSGSAGNLQNTGDAIASIGNPGNFVFTVFGSGIVRLEIAYSNNQNTSISDPNHGFADLCFELEGQVDFPEDSTCVDFNIVAPGESVEGLGAVHPNLNISSPGEAVAMAENQLPAAYGSPAGLNYGMGGLSGFSDVNKIHNYTFSFSPDVSVTFFTVRMLDFGDLNKILATEHSVKLEAFNSNGSLVSTSELSFVTDAVFNPTSSSAGNLQITGDAATDVGNPGNYAFTVAGSDIVRLEMKYSSDLGEGASDPNHGLAVLCFVVDQTDPEIDPPTAELTLLRPKQAPAVGGKFLVEYACSDTAPNLVSATINGYDVVSGQEVSLVVADEESARIVDGQLIWLFAPEFSFDVTCADDNGNEVSTTVVPDFNTP